jgi:hypothetical protein
MPCIPGRFCGLRLAKYGRSPPSHVGPVWHHEEEVDDGHEDDEVDQRADERAQVDALPIDGPTEALPGCAGPGRVDQRRDDVVGEGLDQGAKARATTRPTAMTIRSPCIRKFLKPLSMLVSFSRLSAHPLFRLSVATRPFLSAIEV